MGQIHFAKLAAFLFGSVLLLVAPVQAQENIVANPSFEQTLPNGLPAAWGQYMPAAAPDGSTVQADISVYSIDTTTSKDGKQSARISSDKPVRAAYSEYAMPFIVGQKIHVSVWMKGENLDTGDNHGAWVRLAFNNPKDQAISDQVYKQSLFLKSSASTFDWTQLEGDAVVPDGTGVMVLEAFLWNSKGTAWFDNFSVTVTDGPPNPPGTVVDPYQMNRYKVADMTADNDAPADRRVVFMGDSITDNWKLPTSFPTEKGFINRGIGGQKTVEMAVRFPQDAVALKPKVVWFLGGTNDIAGGFSTDAIVTNVRDMVHQCAQNNIRMIVTSVLPVSDYHADKDPKFKRTELRSPDKIIALNKALQDMCAAEKVTYLDLHSKLVDPQGQMPADLADDGLHPNTKGYSVIAPLVLDAINAELAAKP